MRNNYIYRADNNNDEKTIILMIASLHYVYAIRWFAINPNMHYNSTYTCIAWCLACRTIISARLDYKVGSPKFPHSFTKLWVTIKYAILHRTYQSNGILLTLTNESCVIKPAACLVGLAPLHAILQSSLIARAVQ